MADDENLVRGRGAQYNTPNRFLSTQLGKFEWEGLDLDADLDHATQYYQEEPKKIVNRVDSPDLGMMYSMNPYQGCEHGCIYCYARNTHEYWGFSAGHDFESKIIIKKNAPAMLEKQLQHPDWKVSPIMFSGNTDCYQPIERKLGITRKMLEVLLKYKHPVGMITKNDVILRDLDLLKSLAELNLVVVSVSITTLKEDLRRKLEPRTTTAKRRLEVVRVLSENNIPVNIMVAPIIPAINSDEIPEILKRTSDAGALSAAYTMVRLNGAIGAIFTDWIQKAFPDRAEKVLHQIQSLHGGKLNDSRYGTRMRGEGNVAEAIRRLFEINKRLYFKDRSLPKLDKEAFVRTNKGQLRMF